MWVHFHLFFNCFDCFKDFQLCTYIIKQEFIYFLFNVQRIKIDIYSFYEFFLFNDDGGMHEKIVHNQNR